MQLSLYDTMSRKLCPILPSDGTTLRFYCCGPTVYGPAHIGNFRTFVMQDLFRRVVEMTGTPTRHVRNLTDVDDKTILRSQAENQTLATFTRQWTGRFHRDCAELNLLPPHIEPSAVAHIPDQIALIEKLLSKGHAYVANDKSVYFNTASFPQYGALSRLNERSITTGSGRLSQDEYERESAADFALWKSYRPDDGENSWHSPWGQGRPGWHIECSAMSMKHLGESFDLHSGGVDLIFPHHENEIAQSEAATGKPFVQHWFHIAHLLVDGRKMSKSLGNLHTLADLRNRGYSANELRYVLMSGTYRQPLNFTFASLAAARKAISRLGLLHQRLGGDPGYLLPAPEGFGVFLPVVEALCDDLNSAEALGRLFTITRKITADLDADRCSQAQCEQYQHGFALVLHLFGIILSPNHEGEAPPWVHALAAERLHARRHKDWHNADLLRVQLANSGWQVSDSTDSYTLYPL
ncbi:cysteine--tRNA ligase [Luteolibacter pohnpeiensis]|uniref:Cysteine--tRNA ligase n=1 Tax=Luteolibacter pohnpeiensis TaxID=454153 RepID=A0A934VXR4_9BACT|nr:cysteine--tRNA ligase [Luteolibacter pohnpeiensis]MBK1883759.1 cysteine--tRNA ligase [Luteolibacter pohnpeiensis]